MFMFFRSPAHPFYGLRIIFVAIFAAVVHKGKIILCIRIAVLSLLLFSVQGTPCDEGANVRTGIIKPIADLPFEKKMPCHRYNCKDNNTCTA